jgi:uncharacterized membrane protein YccC
MSIDSRGRTRRHMLRRAGLIAGILVLFALVFLITGHWVLGVIVGAVAAAAVWFFLQVRTVR